MTTATFSYVSTMGVTESVTTTEGDTGMRSVCIKLDDGYEEGNYDEAYVLHDDIPKLIVALQAAYDHKEE